MSSRWRGGVATIRDNPFRYGLVALAVLGGALVWLVSTNLFPYHSINHDEGVYLQQAAMLLDGRLWLTPPVPEAVRPWFFVANEGRLYAKYSPLAAATFAPGLALGVPRLSLATLAAGNTALVGLLGREAFDRRTGLVAATLVLTAPLFVLSSSVFLSYAPTTFLNLTFALGYVRAHRRGVRGNRRASRGYALLAGVAVGLAFFARPYTAVLFALPFVAHALVTLGTAWYRRLLGTASHRRRRVRETTLRLGIVAALGSASVALTLAYNWVLTADPLVFPYQAFAPEDGIGFGHRQILGHERSYTPELAIRANRRVVWRLLAQWGPLGWLGSALAALGLSVGVVAPLTRRYRVEDSDGPDTPREDGSLPGHPLPDLTVRTLLASLFVTVVVGNIYFWGNLNLLAALDDPTDGLIASLGPFYHFDLLAPLSVFGAAGVVAIAERVRWVADRVDHDLATRAVLATAVALGLVVAGTVGAGAFGPPVDRNAEHREAVESAYEPFEETDLDRALVFVPTPYGDWLNHPFQWLRNDPSYSGDAVYVMDRDAAGDFESLDAFPNRRAYRFTYRDDWPPDDEGVEPVLRPLSVRESERVRVTTRVGVVVGAETATVRIAAGGEAVQYGVERLDGGTETISWVVGPERASVVSDGIHRYSENASVPVEGETTVTLSVTFTQPGGSTITYRQELAVDATDGTVRVLWPAETRVCRLGPDCGREGTYVEGGDYAAGVSFASNVTTIEG